MPEMPQCRHCILASFCFVCLLLTVTCWPSLVNLIAPESRLVSSRLVSLQVSDWLPTIVGALTGAAPAPIENFPLDGVNHWAELSGSGDEEQEATKLNDNEDEDRNENGNGWGGGPRKVVLLELDLFTAGPVYDPEGNCGEWGRPVLT